MLLFNVALDKIHSRYILKEDKLIYLYIKYLLFNTYFTRLNKNYLL